MKLYNFDGSVVCFVTIGFEIVTICDYYLHKWFFITTKFFRRKEFRYHY